MIRFIYEPAPAPQLSLVPLAAAFLSPVAILAVFLATAYLVHRPVYYALIPGKTTAQAQGDITAPYLEFASSFIDLAFTSSPATADFRDAFVLAHADPEVLAAIKALEAGRPRSASPNLNVYKHTLQLQRTGKRLLVVAPVTLYRLGISTGRELLYSDQQSATITLGVSANRVGDGRPLVLRVNALTIARKT